MPSIKKVCNWREYNKFLKKRGAIIFSFDENYLDSLYDQDKQRRGGARKYTAKMYEYLLTIKLMFRLPWRATIGFAEGMLGKLSPDLALKVPDYAHTAREASKLKLSVKRFCSCHLSAGMDIAFDSTGVNVYSPSGFKVNTAKMLYTGKESNGKKSI
jgi:hypothetical protein